MGNFTDLTTRLHSTRPVDCSHTCDRIKKTLQTISTIDMEKAIEDIEFLVSNLDPHTDKNLWRHLVGIGCSHMMVTRVKA